MKPKPILLVATGGLAVLLLAAVLIKRDQPGGLCSEVAMVNSTPRQDKRESVSQSGAGTEGIAAEQPVFPGDFETTLQTALADTDSAHRAKLLSQWAATVELGAMEKTLAKLDAIEKPELQFQARGILLSSWVERDLSGMAGWFGNRPAADALHQQARDALVQDFGRRDPSGMLTWMQQSLPESVRSELYGPFFRQWAGADPVAAASRLRQLSEASGEQPGQWNDMIVQMAAVWAGTDPQSAVGWVQSLPDGAAKSQALVQIGYRWAEIDPQSAAAYATRQNDPAMLKAVVGSWTEKDPAAAAAYACGLPGNQARTQVVLAVVSTWASTAPTQAAQWVGQFPESPIREQALSRLMNGWAEQDASAAGRWLPFLPQSPSRDIAVGAYSSAIVSTAPDVAFQWAGSISNEEMRNDNLRTVAVVWLTQDPAAAQQQIIQSQLPQETKKQLLASVTRK